MKIHDLLSWIFWTIGGFSFGFIGRAIYSQFADNAVDFDDSLQGSFVMSIVVVIVLIREWALHRRAQTDGTRENG